MQQVMLYWIKLTIYRKANLNDITNNLLYIRKGKKDFTTKLDEINFVDDNNITEDQLRSKKSER